MIRKLARFLLKYLEDAVPDNEMADLRMPMFHEGDLVERAHPRRPHVLLDMVPQKALIVDVSFIRGSWRYDVLLDGQLWQGISANIVESDWRLTENDSVNDATDHSN